METSPPYRGLGGWLILVVIGLFSTLLRLGWLSVTVSLPTFAPEIWQNLTSPDSPQYHPLWAPLLIFELGANVVTMSFTLALIVLFFFRSKSFPTLMIVFYGLGLVIVVVDASVGAQIPAVASQSSGEMIKEAVRMVIACAIWIPYFLVSKRVKATFTA